MSVGKGKGKGTEGKEARNTLHIYLCRQCNETHQTLIEKGGRKEGNGNTRG
jgi:hypothetical protein